MKNKKHTPLQLAKQVERIVPLLAVWKKEIYKAGYEKGFAAGLKSRPTKTLTKSKITSR